MKVYVVTLGRFVLLVTPDRRGAERFAEVSVMRHQDDTDAAWESVAEDYRREELTYMNLDTGRRGKSDYFITTMEMND